MAQHDYVIDNSTGANVRADINNVLLAISSNNSGSSAPSTTFATQFFADTNAGIMKLRNTSNNGYVNLFTLAGGIDVDAASNFNEDVTFTGASANIVFDKSDNCLEFADNAKAKFGAGNDLQIYHDGNSRITNSTGALSIQADDININNAANNEQLATFTANAAVELFFDHSKKFETTSGGAEIPDGSVLTVQTTSTSNGFLSFLDIGNVGYDWKFPDNSTVQFGTNHGSDKRLQLNNENASSHFHFSLADNGKMLFGASDDLQIFHDGSNSYIKDVGTGDLNIAGSIVRAQSSGGETLFRGVENGAVELYFDNDLKFLTSTSGINVQGNGTGDVHLSVGSNGGTLLLDRNGRMSCNLRADGTSNISGSSGGGSRIRLNKLEINMFTYPHVSSIGDAVTFTERFRVTTSGATCFGTLTETSDIALKSDIEPLKNTLEKIQQIKGYKYNLINSSLPSMGVIAQDVEKVFPELVHGKEGEKALQYSGLIGVLVEAVKDLSAKVAALEAA